jgi:hypothetical protein
MWSLTIDVIDMKYTVKANLAKMGFGINYIKL